MSGNGEKESLELIEPEAEAILTDEAKMLVRVEAREIGQAIISLKVSNEEDYKAACVLGQRNKDVVKRLENFRKAVVGPMNDAVKNVNDIFKKLSSRFTENQVKIDKALTGYFASRKKSDEIKTVRDGDMGTRTSMMKRMDFEVINSDLVTREYCIPDETKIGRAVRAGLLKELPGVRIFEKITPVYANQ